MNPYECPTIQHFAGLVVVHVYNPRHHDVIEAVIIDVAENDIRQTTFERHPLIVIVIDLAKSYTIYSEGPVPFSGNLNRRMKNKI